VVKPFAAADEATEIGRSLLHCTLRPIAAAQKLSVQQIANLCAIIELDQRSRSVHLLYI
jgi:hypothetical protein